ncbi:hypothetical protein [Streptomyces violaceus]|uniref:Integral membrane protein n=1 Tax=Streptomyces violaceus TaxID=1936 RepID=A0ABY9U6E6_STRVL|nr:hypothetical protein [Streptomyces janthinus]WND18433.1 hypothetical protein RI060_14290 [Streptomyces janthinus]GGS76641.1 hypothetical protein GCM10010270_55680 [Streptomyces janthinus]
MPSGALSGGVPGGPPAVGAGTVRRVASRALPVLVALLDGLVVNGLTAGHGTWLALVAAGALLLRRRAPEVAVLAALPGLYLGHIAFAPLIALYCVAVRRGRLLAAVTGAAAVAVAWFLPHPAVGSPLSCWTGRPRCLPWTAADWRRASSYSAARCGHGRSACGRRRPGVPGRTRS